MSLDGRKKNQRGRKNIKEKEDSDSLELADRELEIYFFRCWWAPPHQAIFWCMIKGFFPPPSPKIKDHLRNISWTHTYIIYIGYIWMELGNYLFSNLILVKRKSRLFQTNRSLKKNVTYVRERMNAKSSSC